MARSRISGVFDFTFGTKEISSKEQSPELLVEAIRVSWNEVNRKEAICREKYCGGRQIERKRERERERERERPEKNQYPCSSQWAFSWQAKSGFQLCRGSKREWIIKSREGKRWWGMEGWGRRPDNNGSARALLSPSRQIIKPLSGYGGYGPCVRRPDCLQEATRKPLGSRLNVYWMFSFSLWPLFAGQFISLRGSTRAEILSDNLIPSFADLNNLRLPSLMLGFVWISLSLSLLRIFFFAKFIDIF